MTTNTAPNSYLRDSPRSQLRYLPRLLAFIWRAEPATVALLVLISAGAGLLVVAEVHALRRLVETAQEVIQGGAPLIDAVVWAGVFAGLGFVQAGAFMGKRLIGDHFQEVVRGVIEARCYRQAQSMPLSSFERAEHHDRLTRALRGMDQRFFSTFSFMQWMITHVVAHTVPSRLFGSVPLGHTSGPGGRHNAWRADQRAPASRKVPGWTQADPEAETVRGSQRHHHRKVSGGGAQAIWFWPMVD